MSDEIIYLFFLVFYQLEQIAAQFEPKYINVLHTCKKEMKKKQSGKKNFAHFIIYCHFSCCRQQQQQQDEHQGAGRWERGRREGLTIFMCQQE